MKKARGNARARFIPNAAGFLVRFVADFSRAGRRTGIEMAVLALFQVFATLEQFQPTAM
jgi:hypothetical protein